MSINPITPSAIGSQIEQKTEKIDKNEAQAIAAGLITQAAIATMPLPVNVLLMKQMKAQSDNLDKTGVQKIVQAFENAWESSGIKDKAKVFFIDDKTILLNDDKALQQVKAGTNAFFDLTNNQLLLPKDKLSCAWFHELGHAMNKNLSSWANKLQQIRIPLMYAPYIIPAFGVMKESKPKDENGELTFGQKINNFVRNNIGKLTFLTFVPSLLEEGLATQKGEKIASKLLPADLLASVKKSNRFGFATYAVTAVLTSLSAWAAKEVADKIRKNNNA